MYRTHTFCHILFYNLNDCITTMSCNFRHHFRVKTVFLIQIRHLGWFFSTTLRQREEHKMFPCYSQTNQTGQRVFTETDFCDNIIRSESPCHRKTYRNLSTQTQSDIWNQHKIYWPRLLKEIRDDWQWRLTALTVFSQHTTCVVDSAYCLGFV